MRFIHIADVHLGRRPDISFSWGKSREKELWETFASVVRSCSDGQIDLLLIAGDLFDTQPSAEEIRRVNDLFKEAKETQIVLVSGEHDYLKPESAYAQFVWAPNVHFLKEETPCSVFLEEIDTTVHGLSYLQAEDSEDRLSGIIPDDDGEIQILLAHGGDNAHHPFDAGKLEKANFDYIALGHEHTSRVLLSKNMAYAGSPEPLCKDEIGKHGYILGEITPEKKQFTFVPCSVREYVTLHVRVSSDISQQELEERLGAVMEKQGSQHIYLLCLEGRYRPRHPFDRESLQQIGNVVEVDDRTVPDYDLVALLDAHKDDVVGMYMEELLRKPSSKKVQRALYCGLDALLFQEEAN